MGTELNIGFTVNKLCTKVSVNIYTKAFRLVRKAEFEGVFYADKNSSVKISREYIKGLARGTYYFKMQAVDYENKSAYGKIGNFFLANQY